MASRPPTPAATASPGSHDLVPKAPQWPAGTPWRHSHANVVPSRIHLLAVAVTDRRSHQRPLGGGGLAHLGQHNTTTTPPTQEKLVTTPSKTPKTTPQGTPNFDFALLGPETTPGGKFCFLFCFLGIYVFLVIIARFGNLKVLFVELLHPGVLTNGGVVFDPKKFYCCERWGSLPSHVDFCPPRHSRPSVSACNGGAGAPRKIYGV